MRQLTRKTLRDFDSARRRLRRAALVLNRHDLGRFARAARNVGEQLRDDLLVPRATDEHGADIDDGKCAPGCRG
jgi:hypothetical protein